MRHRTFLVGLALLAPPAILIASQTTDEAHDHLVTEPKSDPKVATVNPTEDDTAPRGFLAFGIDTILWPARLAAVPEVFRFDDGELTDAQGARLQALAETAKERPETKALIVSVASADSPESMKSAAVRLERIASALRSEGVPEERIAQTARAPKPNDLVPEGTVAVGLVAL